MWEAILYTWETTKQKDNMTKKYKLNKFTMNEDVYVPKETDKPEEGKVYALTGGPGTACIANGNTWKESEVNDEK